MNSSSPARLMRSASAIALLAITVGCTTTDDGRSVGPANSAATTKDSAQQARMARLLRFCERLRGGGDLAVAVGMCARAHEIDPQNVEPLLELAITLSAMDRHYEASEAYRRALTIEANDERARFGLGKAYMKLGQYEMAQQQFEAMLERNDRDHRVHNILGVVNDLRGEHRAAQVYYQSGLRLAPGDRTLRSNLGLSLSLTGDHDGAITMLDGFANDPAAGVTTRQNLALAYGLAGDKSAAENIGRIDLSPNAVAQNLAFYDANRGRGLSISDIGNAPPATPQPLVSAAPLADDGSPISERATAEAADTAAAEIAPAGMSEPVEPAAMPAATDPTGVTMFWPLDLPDRGGTAMTDTEAAAEIGHHDLPAPAVIGQTASMTKSSFEIGAPAKHVAAPTMPSKAGGDQPRVLRLSPDIDALIGGSTGAQSTALVRDHALPLPESKTDAAATPVAAADTAPEIATAPATALGDTGGEPLFTLELGSYLDAERSRQAWHDIVAVAPDMFGDMEPVIQPAAIGTDNGAFYRLKSAPIAGRTNAEKVCATLQSQAIYCVIAQATPDPGKLALATPRSAAGSEQPVVNGSLAIATKPHAAPATNSGIVAKVKVVPGIAVSLVEPTTKKTPKPATDVAKSVERSPADTDLSDRDDRDDAGTTLAAAAPTRITEMQLTGGRESRNAAAAPIDAYRYRVQLGSFRQMDHATHVWGQLESKAPELLTDVGYSVERADLGKEKGVYFRLRTGSLADRSTANALCTELQGRDIACLVVRGSADEPASSPEVDAGAESARRTNGPAAGQETGRRVKSAALDSEPAIRSYSVQFGAYRNAEELRQNWRQFKEMAPDLLAGIDPVVQRAATSSEGNPIFQLRTEQLASQDRAEKLCAQLRKRDVGCVVVGLTTPSPATVN